MSDNWICWSLFLDERGEFFLKPSWTTCGDVGDVWSTIFLGFWPQDSTNLYNSPAVILGESLATQNLLLTVSVAFVNENLLNIVVNEPLSCDENEKRRNVNAGHVTMIIIKCIMQYRWWIKMRLNVVYKIKTMLKCLFIFVDQNETKCYNVISSRFVALLLLFCSLTSGAVRVARFSQQNPPNCYSKLAQWHFEGGSPVKFAFQG